jgi:hypothetical protein
VTRTGRGIWICVVKKQESSRDARAKKGRGTRLTTFRGSDVLTKTGRGIRRRVGLAGERG